MKEDERRSGKDRRSREERRKLDNPNYEESERRSGQDRSSGKERRKGKQGADPNDN
jgi:hypothetical protein